MYVCVKSEMDIKICTFSYKIILCGRTYIYTLILVVVLKYILDETSMFCGIVTLHVLWKLH